MIQYSFQEAACLDIVIDSHDKIFNRNVGIMALNNMFIVAKF